MAIHEGNEAMNGRTKTPEKERAACFAQQAALTNTLHNESYRTAPAMSRLKVLIGGLLLFGNKNQKAFWPLFDATLRQYVDLRSAYLSELQQPEPANASQRVSG